MNSVGIGNDAERQAWLERMLAEIPAGARLLDAGAGEQRHKKYCGHLEYVAQDFAQYDGQGDLSGLQTGSWDQSGLDIVGDIAAIPEPDASFDAILCVEVFEHIPHPVEALREFARLLRPGGRLILTAPFCSMTHFAPYHFYTGFTRYFYEHYLPQCGFEIAERRSSGSYFHYLAQELRRLPEMGTRYGVRRSRSLPSLALRAASAVLLRILQAFADSDTGSAELLYYGTHLVAIKKDA
ncbi:MAG: methyltransferase domain-containing protein [Armatimonadota bacterium]|nr:methyltransferase domain-containing protein [Armatimonadota bacterium]